MNTTSMFFHPDLNHHQRFCILTTLEHLTSHIEIAFNLFYVTKAFTSKFDNGEEEGLRSQVRCQYFLIYVPLIIAFGQR
jgi:hypothetical protein